MSVAKTATLPLFAKYVWTQMPIRKLVVGEEMVDDIVILAVQGFLTERTVQNNRYEPRVYIRRK
jgi:hypothetical protein